MVRCRGGHMTFSPEEAQVMVSEAEELKAAGADGIVFGALNEDNGIDRALCATIRKVCLPHFPIGHLEFNVATLYLLFDFSCFDIPTL